MRMRFPKYSASSSVKLFTFLIHTLGILAAGSFGSEVILMKELSKLKIEGQTAGLFYAFFVGAIGAICLTILSAQGGLEGE